MSRTDVKFLKSIHYAKNLRTNCENYSSKYNQLVHKIHPDLIYYKYTPTGMWSLKDLENYKPIIDIIEGTHHLHYGGDPFRNFKLNVRCKLIYKKRQKHDFVMLGFDNRHQLRAFLKDFSIHQNDVAFCFWHNNPQKDENNEVISQGNYKVVIRINPLYKVTLLKLQEKFDEYTKNYAKWSYGHITVYDDIQLASSIHDRWFDPFKMETIREFDVIYNAFMRTCEKKKLYKLDSLFRIIDKRIYDNFSRCSKQSNRFISNISCITSVIGDSFAKKLATSLYYRYLERLNPYKIAKYRKDWKFAAEQFILEVFAKHIYYKKCLATNPSIHQTLENDISSLTWQRDYLLKDINPDNKDELNAFVEKLDREIKSDEDEIPQLQTIMYKMMERIFFPSKEAEEKHLKEYHEIRNRKIKLEKELNGKKDQLKYYRDGYYEKHYRYVFNKFEELEFEKYGLFISKKEVQMFIDTLNLSTKINACKLRKTVLDVFVSEGFMKKSKDYSIYNCVCRRYIFNSDLMNKLIETFRSLLSSVNIVCKYTLQNINLQNHFDRFVGFLRSLPLALGKTLLSGAPPG